VQACFICVGTPSGSDGHADLQAIEAVARTIGRHLNDFVVIITKSTVPVGTAERVRGWVGEELSARDAGGDFAVASNPEFLKEGSAVEDFMRPGRVVIGVDDSRAETFLRDVYASFMRSGLRLFVMDIPSAEMTKYAANCMLATKISFINEMANICDAVGADVELVRQGVGADPRIGTKFLFPGLGYGGSCFPKDIRELIRTAEDHGFEPQIMRAVDRVNEGQKRSLQYKLQLWCELNGCAMHGLTVAVWGLAFKPNTDDIRESPAIALISDLLANGAQVRAHDPHALENASRALAGADGISFHDDAYAAVEGADVLCLVTEWRSYRRPDFNRLAALLRQRTIFDGRNQYDAERLRDYGLTVFGIGCGHRLRVEQCSSGSSGSDRSVSLVGHRIAAAPIR
jgi:UDPglucose 6-dehydrogenase